MNIGSTHRTVSRVACGITLLAAFWIASPRAEAQDETTTDGTIASSSRNTLTVRTMAGRYELFVFEPNTRRPATLTAGSPVRVTSRPGDQAGVRIATAVTLTNGTTPGQTTAAEP